MAQMLYESPMGKLLIEEESGKIIKVECIKEETQLKDYKLHELLKPNAILRQACKELEAYFKGKLKVFHVPIELRGTPFQQQVWQELLKIPYGETISYGEQAKRINHEKAARAVGNANRKNPILIMVPCHRVIRGNGMLSGFGAGTDFKAYLLELERTNSKK